MLLRACAAQQLSIDISFRRRRSAANLPPLLSIDWTDGQTPDRYVEPAGSACYAGSLITEVCSVYLNTLSGNNELIKFADDSTLLVPENSDVSVATEFSYIQDWANDNSMIINLAKSKEIIFYNPRAKPISIPDPIYGIERV